MNMMWKGRLLTLFKVFTSITVTIAIVLFLWKWWQKRRTSSFSVIGEKDEDHEPLSASFHPGELPELLYLPQRAPARTPGLVWYFVFFLILSRYGRLVVVRAGTLLCLSSWLTFISNCIVTTRRTFLICWGIFIDFWLLRLGCCLSGRLELNGVHHSCDLLWFTVWWCTMYAPVLYCSNNMKIFYPVSMWNQYSVESQRTFGSWSSETI